MIPGAMTYKRAQILVIDDDEDDFIITSEIIQSISGNTYKVDWSPSYNDGIRKLKEEKHDLFFVDYRLGARTGIDFLKEAQVFHCEKPIVLLTGKGNYTVDLQAMEFGAIDYLVKTEMSVEKMERCIRYALDRAATMQALKENERKYRTIFEKSKDVVFVTDRNLDFKDVNAAMENVLGYTKVSILDKNLCDIICYDKDRDDVLLSSQRLEDLNDREVIINTADGDKKHCTLTLSFEESAKGDGNLQGIIHDISNLKKIEKANLQGEKLAAAGRLVRTIAHEVRNPLNNIALSIEQMQQELKDNSVDMYMGIIQRNSKRINDLISELLHTARPSEHVFIKHALQIIIDDVIAVSLDRLTLKRIKLKVNYPDEIVEIKADREKLKIAILNVVINAIEAMEEGHGLLSIGLTRDDKNAILTINDNGSGISEENVSRLFEPYFTQKRNGVGLGLTFTLNILQAHKAGIEVSSLQGLGTTFTITFPLG